MKRLFLPQIILSVLLLWALYPHNPYTYYVLLKWISFPIFIYLFIVYRNNMQIGILFIILTILYKGTLQNQQEIRFVIEHFNSNYKHK